MNINSWISWIAGGFTLLLLATLAGLLVVNADQRAQLAADSAAKTLLYAQNRAWAQRVTASNAALAKIRAIDAANVKAIAKAQAEALIGAKKFRDDAAAIGNLKFSGSDYEQITRLTKTYQEHFQ